MRTSMASHRVTASLSLFASLVLPLVASAGEIHSVEAELRRTFPSISVESNATFEGGDTFVRGMLASGLVARLTPPSPKGLTRQMRSNGPAEASLRVLHPRSYGGLTVVEFGSQRIVLRARGALGSSAVESNGKLIYTRPFASTDIVEVPRGNRSEELLLLHDERAPLVYEYEIVAAEGVAAVALDDGSVRFLPKVTPPTMPSATAGGRFNQPAPWLQIDRPWLIDAWGKRTESEAHWTLVGQGAIPAALRLTVTPGRLPFPLLVDPSFSVASNLGTGRSDHTATLLLNGKVLIVGGYNAGALTSAELYDPAKGTFSATGSLTTGREYHTATLLPNGKVLIVGGVGTSGVLSSCELYDPATGTFSVTGSLAAARMNHSSTLLPNGKVLIAGGSADYPGNNPLATAELFDPSGGTAGSFSATGSLAEARRRHTATLLPNGKVLIVGGMGSGALAALVSAEIFDPGAGTNGTFSATGTLANPRYYHTATLLPGGKVLIAGGTDNGDTGMTSIEVFDGVNFFYETNTGLTTARTNQSATLLPDGKVLLAGGTSDGATFLTSVELFDITADGGVGASSASSASMTTGRVAHTATLLPNGKLLIAGGYTGTWSASVEVYDPGTPAFSTTGNLAFGRAGATATLLPTGKVLVAGGCGASACLTSCELYDPATGTFVPTGDLATARQGHTATLLPSGRVLIAGGNNVSGYLSSAELYDPATGTFITTGGMATSRAVHTATLLPNGKVLVAGGYNGSYPASAELYDPAAGSFNTTANLGTPRSLASATLLANGKVLIAGGYNGANLASAELYDPSAGTFASTGNLGSVRANHTATLMANGKVLVTGGSQTTTSAELYDPSAGTFTSTGSMGSARYGQEAALLPNGKVLIVGGRGSAGQALASAELYDPAEGGFRSTATMATGRQEFGAMLLSNEKVLVFGGDSYTTACELYDSGTGFADSRRPVISAAPSSLSLPATLTLTGSGFRGDSEASSGQTDGSSTNYPLVQLQRIDNEQSFFVTPSSNIADTAWSSALSNLTAGWYRLTMFTNAVPSTQRILVIGTPDLTVTKTHAGNFAQGESGRTYTITVKNTGTAPTSGTVTVTDTLPAGLTATAIGGTGWTGCSVASTPTCSRSDALDATSSYPPLTLTVDVATNAAATVTNTVTVSGGGEAVTSNDTATDLTTVAPSPDLTITAFSHTGNFTEGQSGATYAIRVGNSGSATTSGTVTMTATVPSGLSATALSGTGWSCVLGTLVCTRSDALAVGSNYPDITLAVDVALNAPASVTPSVTVSGGGEVNTTNDSATNPTTINLVPDLTLTKTHTGNFARGQNGATYTITVRNAGGASTSGTVTVTDTLPAGLTAAAIGGTGWTGCSISGAPTCSRSDALGAGSSYPPITLMVMVAGNAASSISNTASVSGGGQVVTSDDAATDPTTVVDPGDLTVTSSHSGRFVQGQMFRRYTLTVHNAGLGATTDTVAVGDTLPSGLTVVAMGGQGWTCNPVTRVCTRSDALAAAADYPVITLTVKVATNAPVGSSNNVVTVSGGSEVTTTNDTFLDLTAIDPMSASCGAFPPGTPLTVSDSAPQAVALGDFDGDGVADAVIVASGQVFNTPYDEFTTFRGNGDGTFGPAVVHQLPAGVTPVAVAVGDLNGDGNADLAIANLDANTVSVVAGNGDGTFAAKADYPVLPRPASVAIADFNGDGRADLAVGSIGTTTPGTKGVSVLLSNGTPGVVSFASKIDHIATTETAVVSVAAADFNGDGLPDLALANPNSGTVSILRGVGDGTFTAKPDCTVGSAPFALAVGDFNGDSKLDLAAANENSGSVSILLGNGDATFVPKHDYPAGPGPSGIVAGDFNGDGRPDLAVADSFTNDVSILLGNSDGSFGDAATFSAGPNPAAVAMGDLDGNGTPDLAVVNGDTSGNVAILLSGCPHLTVTKTHTGNFTQGQTGATYTITVSNSGPAATSGTVTVIDTVPIGLTPTSMTGTNWNCSLSTRTCTRSDALAANGSYPAITLTVDVANNAVTTTNSVSVSGGGAADSVGANDPTTIIQPADLTVSVSHGGNFTEGQTGATYTIVVTNSGPNPTAGTVTLSDTLPSGLTATAMTGTGWNCDFTTPVCTRSDALAGGASYPAITLTVNVARNAPASVTNSATVSGGGEVITANDTANDPTTINLLPDLTVTKTHAGNFSQGQTGATYTITVTNSGGAATSGTVSVADILPATLNATALSGSGWSCNLAAVTCSRSDVLAAAANYPAITLTVDVANNAPTLVTNSVTVAGGSETYTGNDTATDPTTITQLPDLTLSKTHNGSFTQGQTGAAYTLTVTNSGSGPTNSAVAVTDSLPAKLTATAMVGTGWTCALATLTCSRSDVLNAGASYPAITLTVTVATNAGAFITNTAAVSGGGDINANNNSASDQATVNASALVPPTNVIATALSPSLISIRWDAVSVAVSYQLFRSSNAGPFTLIGTSTSTAANDSAVVANTTYLYQVKSVDIGGNVSTASGIDLATTILFTDDPLVAGSSPIRAVHLTELRTAVNAVLASLGRSPVTVTDSTITPGVTFIKAAHVTELRNALDSARLAIGVPPIAYTNPPPTPGVSAVAAADINDLRNGVK